MKGFKKNGIFAGLLFSMNKLGRLRCLMIFVLFSFFIAGNLTATQKTSEPNHKERTTDKSAEEYSKQGIDYLLEGQHDLAIADFSKAIEINPRYAEAYNNRGCAYAGKGEYDRAIDDFSKAIEINPMFVGAYYDRGSIYKEKGEYKRAITDTKLHSNIN